MPQTIPGSGWIWSEGHSWPIPTLKDLCASLNHYVLVNTFQKGSLAFSLVFVFLASFFLICTLAFLAPPHRLLPRKHILC